MPTKNNLLSILSFTQPYPLSLSINKRWRNCLAFSFFAFLFLNIFKPFGIYELPKPIFSTALGYGIVCFVMMALLNVAIFPAFPTYFAEDKWTTKSELVGTLINIVLIGLGNFFYSVVIGMADLTLHNLFWFEAFTITIGVFPVTATILIKQSRLSSKFENESKIINTFIEQADKCTKIGLPHANSFEAH